MICVTKNRIAILSLWYVLLKIELPSDPYGIGSKIELPSGIGSKIELPFYPYGIGSKIELPLYPYDMCY